MKKMIFIVTLLMFMVLTGVEKDRLAIMDMQDDENIFSPATREKVTDYIFSKFQETSQFWMIPKADRDVALEQAISDTMEGTRKQCVDEKCQLSMTEQLQANYLINTKIKKLYRGTCNITVSKFNVEKRAGVKSWVKKFNCTEKGLYETIDSFYFGGRKSNFQTGKIGETVDEWNIGKGTDTIIKFGTQPSGAVVLVDGKIICQSTPCSKMITMGKHTIAIQKENYLPKNKIYNIKKGETVNETLEPDFGWLTVSASKETELVLDGTRTGKSSIEKMIINPGNHRIETSDECCYKTGENFQIKRGETKTIKLEMNNRQSAVKVTAQDEKRNDIEAEVYVDGNKIGIAPGTFKIPLCSQKVKVKNGKMEYSEKLVLQEKKVTVINAKLKYEGMVTIPAGSFMMGCVSGDRSCENDENPQHKVYIDEFKIDEHEVTVAEYKKCVDAGACKSAETGNHYNWNESGKENHPINGVNWHNAANYCKWKGKRLPTEAEWEKAARGGKEGFIYPWGNENATCDYAVMKDGGYGCRKNSTWKVCSKPKNGYGLCDMAGNVWEWCSDWYGDSYYNSSPSRNPTGAARGRYRVLRGGSWGNVDRDLRASSRDDFGRPSDGGSDSGFRCASE